MPHRGESPERVMRDGPPCHKCTEKFLACHDRCPKDARGEFGYKAWKAELNRVNDERKKHRERIFGIRYY